MFSVSPIEPIVSLDDAPVSQTDDQCTSAEVCVIGDADPVNVALVNATPVQDSALTSENITTSSVANRDAMFGTLGATETLREERSVKFIVFNALVSRFSTSADPNEKIVIADMMMSLINDHTTSSGNDEFSRHFLEFERDAVQNGGMKMEILAYLKSVQKMDRLY